MKLFRTLLGFAVAIVAAPGMLVLMLVMVDALFHGGGALNQLLSMIFEFTRYGSWLVALPTIGLGIPAWRFIERRLDTRMWHALLLGGLNGAAAPLAMGFHPSLLTVWTAVTGIMAGAVFWLVAQPGRDYEAVRISSPGRRAALPSPAGQASFPTLPR